MGSIESLRVRMETLQGTKMLTLGNLKEPENREPLYGMINKHVFMGHGSVDVQLPDGSVIPFARSDFAENHRKGDMKKAMIYGLIDLMLANRVSLIVIKTGYLYTTAFETTSS